ncbi:MAG: FAD-dependent oxidoreductase [Sedimentibacter sp.]|uniref:FAD-dependent oxidoreductase n=1 Tax=Sedimentibacter sp. TaxID=1960295 RepID=UPI003158B807
MEYPRHSYWHETAGRKTETLPADGLENKKFDLLIIGGGLTGITTAYLLKDSGLKIGIIEATTIGYGVTGFTTAKITVQHSLIYDYLINAFSLSDAKKYLQANQEGLNLVRQIIRENNIDCDFREQTAYVYAVDESEEKKIKNEFEAYRQLGIDGFYTNEIPLPNSAIGAIGIKNQGQFNPLKYLYSLLDIIVKSGSCEVYENVRALNIEPHSGTHLITTQAGNVTADKVVVASHYPFDDSFGLYFLKLYQDKSYVIAAKTKEAPFDGMYINVNDPIHSMRYQFSDKENVLLLGGGNHRAGEKDNEEESYEELEKFLKENFKDAEIVSKWSTQDCMTYDQIPYIGLYSNSFENLYVATGFKKWGMTTSAASALILRNKILNIMDDYSDIFDPSRITPAQSAKEFMSSVKSIASGFIKRVLPVPDEILEVKEGEGKIVHYDGRRVGVYKDEKGDYFCINPVCAHLKCSVSFNEAEKTWDCQCHGSRYDIKGNILEGPTVKPLDRITIEK